MVHLKAVDNLLKSMEKERMGEEIRNGGLE
jgi:hypothetical protein